MGRSRVQVFLSDHFDLFHGSPVFKSSAMLVNSQLVSLPPVHTFKMFMFHLSCYFQRFIGSPISTAVLNTPTLKQSYYYCKNTAHLRRWPRLERVNHHIGLTVNCK